MISDLPLTGTGRNRGRRITKGTGMKSPLRSVFTSAPLLSLSRGQPASHRLPTFDPVTLRTRLYIIERLNGFLVAISTR